MERTNSRLLRYYDGKPLVFTYEESDNRWLAVDHGNDEYVICVLSDNDAKDMILNAKPFLEIIKGSSEVKKLVYDEKIENWIKADVNLDDVEFKETLNLYIYFGAPDEEEEINKLLKEVEKGDK